MTMSRQVQLRVGATSVDLNVTPYAVAAGSWASAGANLELAVVVQATTLTEMDRYVAALQRLAAQARAYDQMLVGDAVEVWTKTCDDVTETAELGATWMKKRMRSLTVLAPDPSTNAAGHYTSRVTLSLEVEELWRRAAPCAILTATSAASTRADGGLTTSGAAVTGRRMTWSSTTGVTVRYRWLAAAANVDFFEVTGSTVKAWWDNTARRFKAQDNAGTPNVAQSSQYTLTVGQEVDLVVRWTPGTGIAIWVNGVADGSAAACTFAQADTYGVFEPTGSQSILSVQLWPAGLTDAQCAALYGWGRPEAELAYVVPPANTQNRNAGYNVYNGPGDAASPLRIMLDGGAQDYEQVRVGWRPLRIPPTHRWECEDGTNGTDTADEADANASGGGVARFTPTDTAWATRSTLVLAADPDDVPDLLGEHRLLLACQDGAGAVNVNLVRWRLVVAGQAEDWSDEFAVAAVSTYSLVDLGLLRIPPGQWPAEALAATTDVHAGSYVALELQVSNTTGSGGGTFDLDAVILQPAEAEGTLTLTFDVSAYYALLDFTGERAAFVGVAEPRSLEFAAWGDYVGDRLELTPCAGEAGVLVLAWLRDGVEQAYMGDVCDVWLFVEPRWMR